MKTSKPIIAIILLALFNACGKSDQTATLNGTETLFSDGIRVFPVSSSQDKETTALPVLTFPGAIVRNSDPSLSALYVGELTISFDPKKNVDSFGLEIRMPVKYDDKEFLDLKPKLPMKFIGDKDVLEKGNRFAWLTPIEDQDQYHWYLVVVEAPELFEAAKKDPTRVFSLSMPASAKKADRESALLLRIRFSPEEK